MNEKIQVLAVVGPTASGKTSLGIELATAFGGQIVSCDSMQIYQGMDIATAKPTPGERAAVSHHLIDFLPPTQSYSVADFVQDASGKIRQLSNCHILPVLVGGTGLYVNSLLDNLNFSKVADDPAVRQKLKFRLEQEGIDVLYEQLCQLDPELAATVHKNNTGRVLRALEVMQLTGKTMTQVKQEAKNTPKPYDALIFGIDFKDRQNLYNRIDQRVDLMVEQGLIDEAKAYFSSCENYDTATQAIGYKELKRYFDGGQTLQQSIDLLKQKTRNYAKRQLTWFRKTKQVHWLYADDPSLGTLAHQAKTIALNWRTP